MLEKDYERKQNKKVKSEGGLFLKFVSPGWSGAPDRIKLMPGGRITFVEMKRPGGELKPLQKKRKEQLEALGFCVEVVDSEVRS